MSDTVSTRPLIQVGQIWRRKSNGKLVQIKRRLGPDDWRWWAVEGKARGYVLSATVYATYEPVSGPGIDA